MYEGKHRGDSSDLSKTLPMAGKDPEAAADVTRFLAELDDGQKDELVGRALRENSFPHWEQLLESIATKSIVERSIRFVEMSGRETELTMGPLERLDSVYDQLRALLPPASPGKCRVVKCFAGNKQLSESTLAALLPEMVSIVCTEESEPESDVEEDFQDFFYRNHYDRYDYSDYDDRGSPASWRSWSSGY